MARFQVKYLGEPAASLDAKLVERGRAALKRLDEALSTTDYLVGERCTLADISLVAYTRLAHEGGFDLGLYSAVQAWIARVETDLDISD